MRDEQSVRLEAILLDTRVSCVPNRVRDLKSILLDTYVSCVPNRVRDLKSILLDTYVSCVPNRVRDLKSILLAMCVFCTCRIGCETRGNFTYHTRFLNRVCFLTWNW